MTTLIRTNNNWKRKFGIIWLGQMCSILSSSIAQFAIVLWIGMETGSAETLAYAAIAGLLPQMLIGPFAGVFVDKWSRKWTMIIADLFVACCSAIIAYLFYIQRPDMGIIYLLLALRSIGGAFHSPAMKSSIPLLAPESELVRIAGVNEVIQSISVICGPMLGAFFLLNFNMSVVMLMDVIGAFIACGTLLFVVIPNTTNDKTSAKSVIHDMHDGAKTFLQNKGMTWMMVSEIIVNFFLMPIIAVMPLMTLQYFNGTPFQVSLVEALFGTGLLIGGGVLGIWNPKIRKPILIIGGYAGLGIVLAACGLLPGTFFIGYAVLSIFQGLFVPLFTGPFTVLMQTQFAPNYLGRIFALYTSINQLPSIAGLVLTSLVADRIGIENFFVLGGTVTVLTAAALFFLPSVNKLDT
nr:MFS transporter [uncultured Chitinophaga sp.]